MPSALDQKIDVLIEISRDTLSELKKMGEVQELKIAHQGEEIQALKEELLHNSEAHKAIYERLERQERRCAGYHGYCEDRREDRKADDHNFDPDAWWAKKVVRWGVVIGGPVITFLITKFAEKIF